MFDAARRQDERRSSPTGTDPPIDQRSPKRKGDRVRYFFRYERLGSRLVRSVRRPHPKRSTGVRRRAGCRAAIGTAVRWGRIRTGGRQPCRWRIQRRSSVPSQAWKGRRKSAPAARQVSSRSTRVKRSAPPAPSGSASRCAPRGGWPQGAGAPAPFNRRPRPSTARNSYPGHPLIARRGERECDGPEARDTPGWPTPAPPTVASASSHAAAVAARPGSTGRVVRVLEPFDDQRYDDGPDAKISVPRPVPA